MMTSLEIALTNLCDARRAAGTYTAEPLIHNELIESLKKELRSLTADFEARSADYHRSIEAAHTKNMGLEEALRRTQQELRELRNLIYESGRF